jgi:hypothetical protein
MQQAARGRRTEWGERFLCLCHSFSKCFLSLWSGTARLLPESPKDIFGTAEKTRRRLIGTTYTQSRLLGVRRSPANHKPPTSSRKETKPLNNQPLKITARHCLLSKKCIDTALLCIVSLKSFIKILQCGGEWDEPLH